MLYQFGPSQFGSTGQSSSRGKTLYKVACVGDPSDHGGSLTNTGGNTTVKARGTLVAISGASHSCPIIGHGITSVSPILVKTYINGKLVLTYGAVAGCGAKITPPDRQVYAEGV